MYIHHMKKFQEGIFMKKAISYVLVAVMILTLAVSLCSCEKAECFFCNEEKLVSQMTEEEVFGEKIYYCNDCKDELEDLLD